MEASDYTDIFQDNKGFRKKRILFLHDENSSSSLLLFICAVYLKELKAKMYIEEMQLTSMPVRKQKRDRPGDRSRKSNLQVCDAQLFIRVTCGEKGASFVSSASAREV